MLETANRRIDAHNQTLSPSPSRERLGTAAALAAAGPSGGGGSPMLEAANRRIDAHNQERGLAPSMSVAHITRQSSASFFDDRLQVDFAPEEGGR